MKKTWACVGFVVICIARLAYPATYTVPGDYATIEAAIDAAPDGSTVLVGAGTYTAYIEALDVLRNIYLRAVDGPAATILSGQGTQPILRIENGPGGDPEKKLVFDGFTFANGRGVGTASSPVTIANASPHFLNCVFRDNTAPDRGGAVLVYGAQASPSFVDCRFTGNRSDRTAGAVLINGDQAQALFKRCHFEDNSNRTADADYYNQGGALYFAEAQGKVIDCVFKGNSAAYAGGAIMALTWWDSAEDRIEITRSRFENNFCAPVPGREPPQPSEGGAIMLENNVGALIEDCVFIGNEAAAGGAVHSYRAHFHIRRCLFDGNRATGSNYLGYGGAIGVNLNDAGDIDRREPTLLIEDTMIRNSVGPAAAGISVGGDLDHGNKARITLENVVIESCRASKANDSYGNGGGLFLNYAVCSARNLYLLNNTAENLGGAAVIVQSSELYLTDSYIVGNHADWTDAAIHDPDDSFYSAVNTVFAFNDEFSAYSGALLAAVPPVTVAGHAGLVYLVAPYEGSPSLEPSGDVLPDRGGYAAGTVLVTGLVADAAFTLESNHADRQVEVLYAGSPAVDTAITDVPGVIEVEDFDPGGEGLAYHDRTIPNEGGAYRLAERVDIAAGAADNGHMVGWIEAGEWLEYTIHATMPGVYNIEVKAASPISTGMFSVYLDGVHLHRFAVPSTGGWATWALLSYNDFYLSQGRHVLRVLIEEGGFNLDSLRIEGGSTDPVIATDTTQLHRAAKVGQTALPGEFFVRNAGANVLNYSISNTIPWLSVSPSSGSSSGESDSIQVAYASASLAVGTYRGRIAVVDQEGLASPVTLDVMLRIVAESGPKNDFDGDGRSDLGVYYPPLGKWYIFASTTGFYEDQFGYDGTVPITGDFDGDGVSDFGVYYAPLGKWYIFSSTTGFYEDQFGFAGTIPITGDFDGDGRDDFGCYHPDSGNWYLFRSTDGFKQTQLGFSGTIPVTGDFDGDGLCDFGYYHPASGAWKLAKSTGGFLETQFGFAGTIPVVGDFDGDGKDDVGVYYDQRGAWYIFRSTLGFFEDHFGYAGTLPVTGDFDGDGQTDIGCYYAPGGDWYIFRSSTGFYQDQFGHQGTLPLGGTQTAP